MKKHKVLMIGPARSVHGGISGVVNNYYEAGLDEKITLKYIGTMVDGSKVRKLLQAGWAYLQFLFVLSRYDIVHVNMASDVSYLRKSFFVKAAKRRRKKIVLHQHGGDFEGYYAGLCEEKKKKARELLNMADVFVALTPVAKSFFETLVEPEKIVVLPNAIQIPELSMKQYGQHKLLFLGRICKEKGMREMFAVMPRLKERYPDVMLYLGGVFEEESLCLTAQEHADCITHLGWISGKEKEAWLRECDIFVLPTYFEGQPVSVLEAMAYGCAVAATPVGGIPGMITRDVTGVLMPPKEEEALYEAIVRLLEDAEFCKMLGTNARQKAAKEFSMEEIMKQLLAIYDSQCGKREV